MKGHKISLMTAILMNINIMVGSGILIGPGIMAGIAGNASFLGWPLVALFFLPMVLMYRADEPYVPWGWRVLRLCERRSFKDCRLLVRLFVCYRIYIFRRGRALGIKAAIACRIW